MTSQMDQEHCGDASLSWVSMECSKWELGLTTAVVVLAIRAPSHAVWHSCPGYPERKCRLVMRRSMMDASVAKLATLS